MPGHRLAFTRNLCRGCIQSLVVVACGGGVEGRPAEHTQAADRDRGPSDSLVLTTGTGAEVWFTLVRAASGANGGQCVERGLEIRNQGKRTRVPLLYTGATPELLNDTTMRAILWKDCQPGEPYLIDLRTGQPVPERGANKL